MRYRFRERDEEIVGSFDDNIHCILFIYDKINNVVSMNIVKDSSGRWMSMGLECKEEIDMFINILKKCKNKIKDVI